MPRLFAPGHEIKVAVRTPQRGPRTGRAPQVDAAAPYEPYREALGVGRSDHGLSIRQDLRSRAWVRFHGSRDLQDVLVGDAAARYLADACAVRMSAHGLTALLPRLAPALRCSRSGTYSPAVGRSPGQARPETGCRPHLVPAR